MTHRDELNLLAFAIAHPQWTRIVRPLHDRMRTPEGKAIGKALYEGYCLQKSEISCLESALSERDKTIDSLRTEMQMVTDRLLELERKS
jgi:hypothetical protein